MDAPQQINNWIPFFQSLLWVFTTLIALLVLRKHIPDLIKRTTKVGALGVEIEFQIAKEFSPSWSNQYVADIRNASSADSFSSGAQDLVNQFIKKAHFDYAVIDLGNGNNWLTSRLFIFSVILSSAKNLKYWVFIQSKDAQKKFIGIAKTRDTVFNLARKYSWLEQALTSSIKTSNISIITENQEWNITQFINTFLTEIQTEYNPTDTSKSDWVQLISSNKIEHASWLTADLLADILGNSLNQETAPYSPDKPKSEQVQAILRRKGDIVALVNEFKDFVQVVDRKAMVEDFVQKSVEPH